MKFLETIISTSYDCTAKDPNRSPFFVFCKLTEEITELSDVYHGIAASEPLNGEIADVIISAVDLLYVCDFTDSQLYGCMSKADLIDSVTHALSVPQGAIPEDATLEEDWFRAASMNPIYNLAMISHYQGRVTRLLNQPERSSDNLGILLSTLIKHTAHMACAVGLANADSVSNTQVKVEHAVEHKVEKWRGKFGL